MLTGPFESHGTYVQFDDIDIADRGGDIYRLISPISFHHNLILFVFREVENLLPVTNMWVFSTANTANF